jgi:lauroyl/myristoyl acyltransferase
MGVWAPFFGQPAYTMTLAARLAQQTGRAVGLLGERLPRGAALRGACAAAGRAAARGRRGRDEASARGHQPRDGAVIRRCPRSTCGATTATRRRGSGPAPPDAMVGRWARAPLLALLWLLHWLPLPVQAALGAALGAAACAGAGRAGASRCATSSCACPSWRAERRALVREHFGWLGRSLLERGLLWYAPPTG